MKSFVLSFFLLVFSVIPTFLSAQKKGVEKPNVIYIYADDLGKGLLSAYGQKNYTTPNIDRLVDQGVSFANAYGCMVCAPARASLLTGYHDCHPDKWRISPGGRYLNNTDPDVIRKVAAEIDAVDVVLPENDYYLPQVFKKAGYVTGQIGKLEWGFTSTHKQMKAHGWDYYFGYLDHVRCHGFYPPYLFENGDMVEIAGNSHLNCGKSIENETEETYRERWDRNGKSTYSQEIFLEKILRFIREHKDEPFFLYHPTQLPHGPVAIPSLHPEVINNQNLTPIEKEYASMVKMLDLHVGLIMDELRRLGLEERTMVVFASDNGHEIYYSMKGRIEKPYRNMVTGELFDDFTDKYYSEPAGDVFNGNDGMAGLKRSNLEGGVHIPLVFYWKGVLPKGVVSRQVVSNYDFLPTMADMLHVSLPLGKDGISLWPHLIKQGELPESRYVVFSSNYGPAIVNNRGWKLRYFKAHKTFELYNLRQDPAETQNLIEHHPTIVFDLKQALLKECRGDIRNGINRAG